MQADCRGSGFAKGIEPRMNVSGWPPCMPFQNGWFVCDLECAERELNPRYKLGKLVSYR